ncbi:hypothetical protein FOTG_12082 [Fusarium oxysporum f. sp. vasinfectum 25433]|uniref:Uncharacterized protein n=1 Tax=Fusarium oxysporum f. sp. vasinfectum 25433 TaxID=1089449 RepID=X0LFQ4_FUSOX|nr:hypothetical protein FOTG_12082 [Fusarium oxysporum f. sp. vasinfectum 25433]
MTKRVTRAHGSMRSQQQDLKSPLNVSSSNMATSPSLAPMGKRRRSTETSRWVRTLQTQVVFSLALPHGRNGRRTMEKRKICLGSVTSRMSSCSLSNGVRIGVRTSNLRRSLLG